MDSLLKYCRLISRLFQSTTARNYEIWLKVCSKKRKKTDLLSTIFWKLPLYAKEQYLILEKFIRNLLKKTEIEAWFRESFIRQKSLELAYLIKRKRNLSKKQSNLSLALKKRNNRNKELGNSYKISYVKSAKKTNYKKNN